MSSIAILLIVVLVVLALSGGWGYRTGYYNPGVYGAGGLVALVLVILLIALLFRSF